MSAPPPRAYMEYVMTTSTGTAVPVMLGIRQHGAMTVRVYPKNSYHST